MDRMRSEVPWLSWGELQPQVLSVPKTNYPSLVGKSWTHVPFVWEWLQNSPWMSRCILFPIEKMADFPASHSNSFQGCHDQGIWEKERGGHPQAVQNLLQYLLLVLCFDKLAAWVSICLSTKWETWRQWAIDWGLSTGSNLNLRFLLQDDSFNMYYY